MRFSTVAFLGALSSVALAQSLLDQLPKCAQVCFGSNFGGCQTLDIGCICGNAALIAELSCCVSKGCTAKEADATIKFAAGLCQANGISVPSAASCAASSGASSTPAPASSSSGSGVAASSAAGSTTAAGSSASSAVTSAAKSVSSASPSAAAAGTSGSTGAAALHTAGTGMGMGMGLAMAGLLVAL
ncbi:hypothetical protein P154DRAFT_525854 [Amniculicola lignicola CBS 123094]|uniref:CFEM domain-containing protein n=1 Tax=Amniculicola lignicola CBS 123094 TaxID=1392246 RepID=A0A6A5W5D3_9PLEO|nr:hypothetical protein P154DRAFT_525854 [Amniculicola lignicola CBS 123094]